MIEGEEGGISNGVGWKGGGGFRFYRLGPPVFDEEGRIRSDIRFPVLAAHVWFSETGRPWDGSDGSPVLGCTTDMPARCSTTAFWATGGRPAGTC